MTRPALRRVVARTCAILLLVAGTGVLAAARAPARRVVVEYYENGRVRRESTYRGDLLDGPSRGWYETGVPQFEYSYRRGLGEGIQRQWYPGGQPYTLFHHHTGHERGQQQMWNVDGTIRSNYVIRDGRRFGLLGALGCTGKGRAVGDMQ